MTIVTSACKWIGNLTQELRPCSLHCSCECEKLIDFYWFCFTSDGGMTLVTILLHIPCTRVYSRFIFKNAVEQIRIFSKTGN